MKKRFCEFLDTWTGGISESGFEDESAPLVYLFFFFFLRFALHDAISLHAAISEQPVETNEEKHSNLVLTFPSAMFL